MWGEVLGGIGAISSLFGGGGGSKNYGMSRDAILRLMSQGNQLGTYGSSAMSRANGYAGRADGAIDAYARYLSQDPYTNQYAASRLADLTRGMSADRERALASSDAEMAARGLAGSSVDVGARTGIRAAGMAALGGARATLGREWQADVERRKQALVDLLSGAQSSYYNQGLQAYNASNQAYGSAAGYGLNYGNAQSSADASWLGQVGGVASTLGGIYSNYQAGRKATLLEERLATLEAKQKQRNGGGAPSPYRFT